MAYCRRSALDRATQKHGQETVWGQVMMGITFIHKYYDQYYSAKLLLPIAFCN